MAPFLTLPLDLFLTGSLLLFAAGAAARLLPSSLGERLPPATHFLASMMAGTLLLGYGVFGLTAAGYLTLRLALPCIGLMAFFAAPVLRHWLQTAREGISWSTWSRAEKMGAAAIAIVALVHLLNTYAPPTTNDELGYQASLPILYASAGRMVEMPDNFCSYYPLLAQMLYTAAALLRGLLAMKPMVWFSGFLTFLALWDLGREGLRLTRASTLLATLLFYSSPFSSSLHAIASSDFWGVFCALVAIRTYILWREDPHWHYLTLIGLCVGAGLSFRPYGAGWAMPLLLLFLWHKNPKAFFYAGTVGAFLFLPWLLRNAVWTGNPFYPKALWPGAAADLYFARFSDFHSALTPAYYLFLPIAMAVRPLVWGIGLLPIAFAPSVTFFRGLSNSLKGLLIYLTLAIVVATSLFPLRDQRYFGPAYALLCLLGAMGFAALGDYLPGLGRRLLIGVTLLCLVVPNGLLAIGFASHRWAFLSGQQSTEAYVLARGHDEQTRLLPIVRETVKAPGDILVLGALFSSWLYYHPAYRLIGMARFPPSFFQRPSSDWIQDAANHGIQTLMLCKFAFHEEADGSYLYATLPSLNLRLEKLRANPRLTVLHDDPRMTLFAIKGEKPL